MPDLYFKVGVKGGKATLQELNELDRTYDNVGKKSKQSFQEGEKAASLFGGSLHSVKEMAAGLGLMFGAMEIAKIIKEWTSAAVGFEREFANVTTLFDTSKVNAEAIKHEIHALNSELGNSVELTKGVYQAISSGVAPEKAVKFVEAAAKFSKAALTDTFTSVDVITTILNAYGRKTEEVTQITDDLFEIVNQGKTTGEELAQSLGPVIPVAAALEVNFKELGAAIATLTKGGFDTAMAVTSLNAALTNYLSPTKEAVDLSIKMGVSLDAQQLRTKGLVQTLGELAEKTKGNQEATSILFGNIRALRGILALTGKQAEEFNKIFNAMKDTTGKTDTAFKKQMDTISGQWDTAMVSMEKRWENLILKIGPKVIDILTAINRLFKDGTVPINEYTFALAAFGVALAGLKIAAFVSAMRSAAAASSALFLIQSIKNVGDFGAAIQLATGSMGVLGKATLVAGAAFAGWKLGRWIAEIFDLDNKLGNLWRTMGLFQGRVDEMTQGTEKATTLAYNNLKRAYPEDLFKKLGLDIERNGKSLEEWRLVVGQAGKALNDYMVNQRDSAKITALQERANQLNKEHAATIKALGLDLNRGAKSLDDWKVALDGAEISIKKGIPMTEDQKNKIKELTEQMEKGANPAKELANNLALLRGAGKSQEDFIKAYSKQIVDAVASSKAMGNVIPEVISKMYEKAKAYEYAKDKAAELEKSEQSLKEIMETGIPIAIANLNNPEIAKGAKGLIDHVAQVAMSSGKVRNLAEAYELAVKWIGDFDKIITDNKEKIREQAKAIEESYTVMSRMQEVYQKLGISQDKSILLLEKEFKKLLDDGTASSKMVSDALSNIVRTAAEQGDLIGKETLNSLDDLAFGTDAALREKLLPVWLEYYKSLQGVNGEFPVEFEKKLMEVVRGNNRVLKAEMMPAWQAYLESIKKMYGKLPEDIQKIDKKLNKDVGADYKTLGDKISNQISTITTDWSKGIADMVFDSKKGTDSILDMFEEFGKAILRTLLESLFEPARKAMDDFVKDVFDSMTKKGKSDTGTGSVPGAVGNVLGNSEGKSGITDTLSKIIGWGVGSSTGETSGGSSAGGGSWFGKMFGSSDSKGTQMLASVAMMSGMSMGLSSILDPRNNSAGSWLKAVGGGALTGAAIGMMGGPIGAAVGAAVGLAAKGISSLVGLAQGDDSYQSISKKTSQNYGGVSVTDKEVQSWWNSKGGKENQAWGVRGQILVSPSYLSEVVIPKAKEQGKLEAFMKSLDKVNILNSTPGQTSKETRQALEIGMLTGDYSKYNEEWLKFVNSSGSKIKNLDNWKSLMVDPEKVTESATAFVQYYQELQKTGELTQEFTDYVEENRKAIEESGKTYTVVKDWLAEYDQVLSNTIKYAAELDEIKGLKEGFTELKDTLEAFTPASGNAVQTFIQQGIVTDQLRDKINELGGDAKKLETVAGLLKTNNYFGTLITYFQDTGKILPDLNKMLQEYGANMSIVAQATDLAGLKQSLTDIADFRTYLGEVVADTTGLQDVMNGLWNDDVMAKLVDQGLNPAMLEGIAKLSKGMNDWTSAVENFKKTGTLTEGGVPEIARQVMEKAGLTADQLDSVRSMFGASTGQLTESGKVITDMLLQYGGAEGQNAVNQLGNGINLVTTGLLNKTKEAMDAAYKAERDDVLAYLDKAQAQIQSRSDLIQSSIEEQFQIVGTNIQKAFAVARESAVTEIDIIMEKLDELNKSYLFSQDTAVATSTASTATDNSGILNAVLSGVSGVIQGLINWDGDLTSLQNLFGGNTGSIASAASGAMVNEKGLLYVHSGEEVKPAKVSSLPGGGGGGVTFILENNGTIIGLDELDTRVKRTIKQGIESGEFAGVLS